MSGLAGVALESERPRDTAAFWSALLGGTRSRSRNGDELVHLDSGLSLRLLPSSAPKTAKNRIHLDLAGGADARDQAAVVDRAVRLGAVHADIGQNDGPRPVPWVVLADPAGNEFCVLEPRSEYADTGSLAAVVVDVADPHGLGRFWSAAIGWPVVREHPEYVSLRRPDGRGEWLELLRAAEPDDPARPSPRCRLELAVPDGPAGLTDEAERLTGLGAVRRGAGRLTDPEGGLIELVSTS
ncbi:hypothetical protein HQ32_02042 [Prauserella sp. Am3]|nr:hypothetical protein HQ32_02042 [Prauserella sp. Am3]